MSVRDYYLEHFDEMSLEKQKHFATRIKYWFKDAQFDDFLAVHEPSHDLAEVLANNDYSKVNNLDLRRPFFEKYPELYGLEATLFRINRLLIEYNVDLRDKFLELFPRQRLEQLCENLLADTDALITLSTYAANVICLSENLFLGDKKYSYRLAETILAIDQQTINFIYLYTHIILCLSNFYTRDISEDDKGLALSMLTKCNEIIRQDYSAITLDMKLEFLVCCRMLNYGTTLESDINVECKEILNNSSFLIDSRKPEKNTLDAAEHRNVLYIMSGLDY